ncbi:MAG: YggS family pyridoxal phosphate-dependent enzyme [Candidatus Micrarchaeota archaeon]
MSSISERTRSICASLPPGVRLVVITKGQAPGNIRQAIGAGAKEIGESKVQEAAAKLPALKAAYPQLVFHMVGHLQGNKAKEAVQLFDCIQGVDSVQLAQKIADEAEASRKKISILVQFRISGKEGQYGYSSAAELDNAILEIRKLEEMHSPYFRLEGLMGIASRERPAEDFSRLRVLAKSLSLPVLSMGMSGDYRIAIEEGSNMVRIGRAIFEDENESG